MDKLSKGRGKFQGEELGYYAVKGRTDSRSLVFVEVICQIYLCSCPLKTL